MRRSDLFPVLLLIGLSFASDFLTEVYDYSRTFAAIGLFATAGWAAYTHMLSSDPMAKKDAWETLTYAVIGVVLVMMAPMLTKVLS